MTENIISVEDIYKAMELLKKIKPMSQEEFMQSLTTPYKPIKRPDIDDILEDMKKLQKNYKKITR